MSDSQQPAWLEKALAERSTVQASWSSESCDQKAPPAVGQLRVLRHRDPRIAAERLGLIVSADEELPVAHVLLVSPLVEYRTAVDFLLEPSKTSAPMPLIAECDLRGSVWFDQLRACVGRCEPSLATQLDAVGAGALPDAVSLEQSGFGLPARDARDPRWAWKLAELDALNMLTHDCDQRMLDGQEWHAFVDPALITWLSQPGVLTPEMTDALCSTAKAHHAWVTADSLEPLNELIAAADPVMKMALVPLVENALSRLSQPAAALHPEATWVGRSKRSARRDRRLVEEIAQRAARGERCVDLITSPRLWGGKESAGLTPDAVSVAGEARIQVQLIDFDPYDSEVTA